MGVDRLSLDSVREGIGQLRVQHATLPLYGVLKSYSWNEDTCVVALDIAYGIIGDLCVQRDFLTKCKV